MTPIGIVGGYGAVGSAAAAQLAAWHPGPVVLGGRDPARADVALDLADGDALGAFCARFPIIVNCAGPSATVRDRVARAARAAGADYIDPGGDDAVHELLTGTGNVTVLSAGMLPGLTGLLPRALVAETPGAPIAVVGYIGGLDRFTHTAATDYVASLRGGFGRSAAVWRDGGPVDRAPIEIESPYFPETATGHPFLSTELARLACRLRLSELDFFNLFPGVQVRAALSELAAGTGTELRADAARLVAASELDLVGRQPYQRIVFRLRTCDTTRTLVLSGSSASALTGTMTAIATMAVIAGAVSAGTHFAAEVLGPEWTLAMLRTADPVLALEIFEGSARLEEGVL